MGDLCALADIIGTKPAAHTSPHGASDDRSIAVAEHVAVTPAVGLSFAVAKSYSYGNTYWEAIDSTDFLAVAHAVTSTEPMAQYYTHSRPLTTTDPATGCMVPQ